MKLLLFNYQCAECNAITKAPGLPDMAYGEFIMFNNSGDAAYLSSFHDPVFSEFEAFLEKKVRILTKLMEKMQLISFKLYSV